MKAAPRLWLGLKSQLEARSGQLKKQIEGLTAQRKATDEAAALVERDYTSLQKLYEKKLVSLERVSELQLELSRLKGEAGRLAAAIAETEGKISETALQALQVDEDMRKDVNEELRELDGKEVELIERKVVAKDQLARTEIRAPQSGFVQELAVHTVGGVIAPGETLMLIVPEQDRLVIDAMVAPASIDDVKPGQPVSIRFPAFDAATTPECKGTVQRVSADLIKDPQRQVSYFVAQHHARRPGDLPQGRQAPAARHAGGSPHPDRRAQRLVLCHEAAVGPDEPGVQGVTMRKLDQVASLNGLTATATGRQRRGEAASLVAPNGLAYTYTISFRAASHTWHPGLSRLPSYYFSPDYGVEMTITYTKSFASAAAFRNFFKTMKNSAIFDREYESIEFVYGDGHVGQKCRVERQARPLRPPCRFSFARR